MIDSDSSILCGRDCSSSHSHDFFLRMPAKKTSKNERHLHSSQLLTVVQQHFLSKNGRVNQIYRNWLEGL